jgi:hypothetical protein
VGAHSSRPSFGLSGTVERPWPMTNFAKNPVRLIARLVLCVPKAFFVRNSSPNLEMWRTSLGVPLLDRPSGLIMLFQRSTKEGPFLFQRDRARFEIVLTKNARERGFQLWDTRTLSAANQPGFCMEFGRSQDQKRLLRCAFEGSPVAFFFDGDSAYIPDFLSMINGVDPSRRDAK